MKKSILLISMILLISTMFALNPLNYIPADVDAALELSVPEEILPMFGVDSDALEGMAPDVLNTNIELQDMQLVLYGKFGLNAFLMEVLDFDYMYYDIADMLDSEMALSALTAMPICVITNAINMEMVFGFLEGEFMQEAIESGVHFEILTEEIDDYVVKHYKVRYYDDYDPVFFDIYLSELEDDYYLASNDYDILKTSLNASRDDTLRLSHYDENMTEDVQYFARLQNSTFTFSSLLLRIMNIVYGKAWSEFIGVGIEGEELFLDFYVDMEYISDSFEKNTELYKTDVEFFKAMPSFKDSFDIDNFISIPRTNIPLELLGEILYELPMVDSHVDDIENYFEILPLMGPELERVNLCYSNSVDAYLPYMLAKCTDVKLVYDNFVEMHELETATVGYIEYSYIDEVYIGYDSRYDYIEIYAFDLASHLLRTGELLFTNKLNTDKEYAEYIYDLPEYLWGFIHYDDFITLDVEFDKEGDFALQFAFDLASIADMQEAEEKEMALYNISSGYVQIMNHINDQFYYYPDAEIDVERIYEGLRDAYVLDPDMLAKFKISMATSEDNPVFNVYYNGELPEGTTLDDLATSIENNIYYGDYTIDIRGDIVLLRVIPE